jgi:DNA (cytosine-5)-methyltransferase 1
VLSDLEGIGYATRTFVIPACAVDARHRRDRVWIVAHATGGRFEQCDTESKPKNGPLRPGISYTRHEQSSGRNEIKNGQQFSGRREAWSEPTSCCLWEPEPDVGRVAHGIPSRVDRLKGLGNAIVPQVAYEILREIRKLC